MPRIEPQDEMLLRLQFPNWCRRFALEPALARFEDNTWWRLLSLTQAPFDKVAWQVGSALLFAVDSRRRLLRGAPNDLSGSRWALERAALVPASVTHALREACRTADVESYAALSLLWCLDTEPALRARMRLRFAREQVPVEEPASSPAGTPYLIRLWSAGTRAQHKNTLNP